MAPPRDGQVVCHLPDVMSKTPGKAVACAIPGNPDPPKSHQTQLLPGDKEQLGRHVKQRPTELVAIGPVKTEAHNIEDSGRENLRFGQCDVLGTRYDIRRMYGDLVRNGQ